MKKIYAVLLGLALFFGASCLESSGQTVSATDASSATSEILYRAGYLWYGEDKLTRNDLKPVLPESVYKDYLRSRRLYGSGLVLSIAGGTFFTIGTTGLIYDKFFVQRMEGIVDVGAILCVGNMILGGICLIPGVTCLCVGIKDMKQVASQAKSYSPQLTLGPTSSGFGLALKF